MSSTNELEAIGEDFYSSLNDLTFNSRPIISSLTVIAQENVSAAPYIARAVERRIEKVSIIEILLLEVVTNFNQAVPNQKLYSFYLLDSISKNVGSPYTLLFGQKLYQTFTQAFLLVDDLNRKKFIDLFKTWKTAKTSSGLPLFPQEPVNKIEQFLIKASSIYQKTTSSQKRSPIPKTATPTPQPQQQQSTSLSTLIPIVDRLLELTNQRLKLNPTDETILQKIQIINQLKIVIQSEQMNHQQLLQVKFQLEEMTKSEESFIKKNSPKPQNSSLQSLLKPSPSPIPVLNDNSKNPLGLLNNIINLKPPKKDLSSLISNLEQKGLMKQSNNKKAVIPSNSVLKSLLSKPKIPEIKQEDDDINPFKNFKLDNKFITDCSEIYINFFIKEKPNKCGTCGKRFSSNIQGQSERRAHLDWHFRINKRLKESKIIQSRSWFLDDDEFVNFRDWEIFNGGETKEEIKIESKREKKYVIVPEGGDMNCICGICKEIIKASYNDDLGEWIWDDCIMKQGRVFHETCYEESTTNTNTSLLSGLLNKREREVDFTMLKDIVKNVKLNPTQ